MDGPCSVPSTDADAMDVGPSGSGEWHVVAKSDQLARENARVQITADGRYLVVARSGGRLYAFDATCYHMGAPLLHGDIEDVAGHGACITCPWHHYQISMSSGERLYQDMSRKTCTLPKKQRVHEVMEADGEVRVRLSGGGKPPSPPPGAPKPKPHEINHEWESDRYAFKPPPPSQAQQKAPRSGKVFNRANRADGGRFPGAGAGVGAAAGGLHPGLVGAGVGREVGRMVADSMRGGDGKAPWAMRGGFRQPQSQRPKAQASALVSEPVREDEELPDAPGDGEGGAC